jgi:hypothetical protein
MNKLFYSKASRGMEPMKQKGLCNRCKKSGIVHLTIMGDMKCRKCCDKLGRDHIAKS